MRMRKGAPLLFALAALLGSVQAASASHCGALRFSNLSRDCGDAQCCYSTCQQQNRVCYKLVYDEVLEKRWRTCYQTVCETVNKQVCKTCFREETRYRDCQITKYKLVSEECMKPVQRQCWKEIACHEYRPQVEQGVKNIECTVKRCVPKHCEKACHYTVHCPVYEQHCHVHCGQVQKLVAEVHCKQVCQRVCRQVVECCHKEVCCQVSKCIEECCVKQVCVPCCRTVQETCYKTCTKRICEPVHGCKTVTRRVVECVEEPYTPLFGGLRGLFSGLGRNNNCDPCQNAGNATTSSSCDPCFDPCACKTFHLFNRNHGNNCSDACNNNNCGNNNNCCTPCPTRKVWRVKCVTEQVPCVTYVTRCVTEKVPYTVCRKENYTEMRNISYTTRRNVRGAYVDEKGVGHECDGPGRTFKECAVARKLIPYTVTRNVTTLETKQVPYTVTRCVRGAYVDDVPAAGSGSGAPGTGAPGTGTGKGAPSTSGVASSGNPNNYATDGPGRRFQEGAVYKVVTTSTSCRMVAEQRVRMVPYTVYETVYEKQIKQIPYQVCRMVPHCVTKRVPYTECVMEKFTVCKKVPYTECVKQAYTCRVPYTVVENVPCTVMKKVKVCVPETVCVKKARMVPYDPGCPTTTSCCNDCCETRSCFLSNLRQRWFSSLCSNTCKDTCTTTCNTTCNDTCREGLLQRLFRNRFACEPSCDTGCSSGAVPANTTPAEPINPPKKLPQK
jgi:hypothetical protein